MANNITKNIIFQTQDGPATDFEFAFNENVLFKKVIHENYFNNNKLEIVLDDSIIIYSCNKLSIGKEFKQYLNKFKNFKLLHCSNESLNHLTGYYKRADAVIRSGGWNPNISNIKVFSIPLAFQSEYYNNKPNELQLENRQYAWCFFGTLKGDRANMYKELSRVSPFFHFQSKGWMASDNKTPLEVIEYYKNMIFIPSPIGNIYFECNRTLDALEWGCIPVTTKFLGEDCYRYIYGDHPFIVGVDWADAAKKMEELLAQPDALLNKQKEVRSWYLKFKEQLADDVTHILKGDFDQLKGKQFLYQKAAKKNARLKWKFFKHFTLDVYLQRFFKRNINS